MVSFESFTAFWTPMSATNTVAVFSFGKYTVDQSAATTVAMSQGENETGYKLSVPKSHLRRNSFVVGSYISAESEPTFNAGKSFTLTPGTPIAGQAENHVANESSVATSSFSTCPKKQSLYQFWAGICFAFAPG